MPLDIGVGLLLGVYLRTLIQLPYGVCLLVGVAAALLPDLDYIFQYLRKDVILDTTHRDLIHYPLLLTPAVGLIGLLFAPEVAFIVILGVFAHFIHDSFGVGFGIKWLYPFINKSYLFVFQASTPANKTMPRRLIHAWTDSERAEMIKRYRYDGWIRHLYFRFHPFGLFEYSVLVIGILVAVISAR